MTGFLRIILPMSPAVCPTSLLKTAEDTLRATCWPALEAVQYANFERILEGFARYRVGEEHFASVTGYGHDDMGRMVTDKVFAHALQAEAALVRTQFVSGTHALAVALNGALRPGSTMLSLTGAPYDTLEEVIGLRGEHPQSLKAKGIGYEAIDVLASGKFSLPKDRAVERRVKRSAVAYIQRSRGYSLRPTLTMSEMEALCQWVKSLNPEAIILVDNCYGEFTNVCEPTAVGADLMAGSLIKNPGGGIVPTGGYVAGREDLVEVCAGVLTAPGIGRDGGYTFDLTRLVLQGLYLAPGVVKEALKGMTLAARVFESLGYATRPHWNEPRGDIIQVITLGSAEKLVAFCEILQSLSPVNAAVKPIPSPVPGYADQVVMAGGTFIQGATLELSADGPLREPYAVYLQGGLTYAHTRLALSKIIERLEAL